MAAYREINISHIGVEESENNGIEGENGGAKYVARSCVYVENRRENNQQKISSVKK